MSDLTGRVCLITGATGFVGSWLAERLVGEGAQVRCLVRRSSQREFLPTRGIEVAHGDVTDQRSLPVALAGVDYVFHVAGLIKARQPSDFNRVNFIGTVNLLAACQATVPRLARLVVVSSLAAVGPSAPGLRLDEDCPPGPVSPYGRSKLHAEEAARAFAALLPIAVIRPPAVYGPRDRETLQLMRVVAHGIRPVVAPTGAFSVVHVADLVDGIIRTATEPAAIGRTYFVCGDEAPSPRELVTTIGEAVGRPGVTVPIPRLATLAAGYGCEKVRELTGLPLIFDGWKAQEMALARWASSNARAKAELGFQPQFDLVTGLSQTVGWYRKAGWL